MSWGFILFYSILSIFLHAGKYYLINIHVYFYATLRFQVLESTCLKLHGFFSLVKHKHHQPFKIESCISKHTIAIVDGEWEGKNRKGKAEKLILRFFSFHFFLDSTPHLVPNQPHHAQTYESE